MYQLESMRIWSKSKSRSERIDDALPCSSRAYFWGSRIESEAGEDCDFLTTNLGIKLFQSIYPGDNGELICDKHPITTQGGFNLHLYFRVGLILKIRPTLIFYLLINIEGVNWYLRRKGVHWGGILSIFDFCVLFPFSN